MRANRMARTSSYYERFLTQPTIMLVVRRIANEQQCLHM
jgi:hypothetical protein